MRLVDEPAIQQQAEDDMAETGSFWFMLALAAVGLAFALGHSCAQVWT